MYHKQIAKEIIFIAFDNGKETYQKLPFKNGCSIFYWHFTKCLNLSFESVFFLVNNVANFVFVFDVEVNVMKLVYGCDTEITRWGHHRNLNTSK